MDWKMLLIGAGASAGIMSMLGNKLQTAWQRATAWIVERHRLDEDTGRLLLLWLQDDGWKPLPFQSMSYQSAWLRVAAIDSDTFVPTKTSKADEYTVALRKGIRIFRISFKKKWYEGMTSTVAFWRFTFDFDAEIAKASKNWQKRMQGRMQASAVQEGWEGKTRLDLKHRRFCIKQHYGSHKTKTIMAVGKEDGDKPAAPEPAVQRSRDIMIELMLGERQAVGYDIKDLSQAGDPGRSGIDDLALSPDAMRLVEDAHVWKSKRRWFEDRGLPWRRGWLIHSAPGNGKSSLVRAIGTSEDLPIHVLNIPTMNNSEFVKAWAECVCDQPCIALVEDIDATFRGRVNLSAQADDDALTFDCLLNAISGVDRSEGVFLVVTTNDPSSLDPALGCARTDKDPNGTMISTRPGRLDRVLHMPPPDEAGRRKIAQRVMKDMPAECIKACVAKGEGDSGAQFQERCGQAALAWMERQDCEIQKGSE